MLKGQRVHAHNVHNYFYSVLRLHVGLNSGFSVSCGLCERHLSSRADHSVNSMTVMFYGQMRQENEKYLLCSCNAFRMIIKYCLLNITSVSFNSF